MKTMVLSEACPVNENPLRLAGLSAPTPGPGQIWLRVRVCGVCLSH